MPLSVAQRYEVRRWVGSAPPDADLDANFDRLGTVRAVIEEILQTRLADFTRAPATFAIPGEYSQSVGDNIDALQDLLASLNDADLSTEVSSAAPAPRVRRLVRAGYDDLPGR